MLASDLNNPEFTGAINPDSRLAVNFYSRLVQNNFKTEKEGRPIYESKDYVKIFIPGDSTTVIDTPVTEEYKKRFPLHWAHYQNTGGGSKDIGTPLIQWPLISAVVAKELEHFNFKTVESVAFASDQQIQSIGMAGGMSPLALRDKAKSFLAFAKDSAVADKQAEDNKKLRERLEALESKLAQQEEKPKRKYTRKAHGDNAPTGATGV